MSGLQLVKKSKHMSVLLLNQKGRHMSGLQLIHKSKHMFGLNLSQKCKHVSGLQLCQSADSYLISTTVNFSYVVIFQLVGSIICLVLSRFVSWRSLNVFGNL